MTGSDSSHALHCANAMGKWVWSTTQGFAAPSSSQATTSTLQPIHLSSPYHTATQYATALPQYSTTEDKRANVGGVDVAAWLSQPDSSNGQWPTGGFVDIDGSPLGIDIDLGMPMATGDLVGCGNEYPVSPQDSLSTPGLSYSSSSVRAMGSCTSSTGANMAVPGPSSSAASTPSVPVTPVSLSCLEADVPMQMITDQSVPRTKQLGDASMDDAQVSQSLADAFDFTHLAPMHSAMASGVPQEAMSSSTGTIAGSDNALGLYNMNCIPLTRASTSISSVAMPTQIAMPAPGWLDPQVVPTEWLLDGSSSQVQQGMSTSVVDSNPWLTPVSAGGSSVRYGPYRSPSIASTASTSSQSFAHYPQAFSRSSVSSASEMPTGRRRSLTTGSLSGQPSSLVDRVRVMGVAQPPSPGLQHSVQSSPGPASPRNFNSMPSRRARGSASPLPNTFARVTGGSVSIRERRMTSSLSKASTTPATRSPLKGLFALQDLGVSGDSSPTVMTDVPLEFGTLTGSTLGTPSTPVSAGFWSGRSESGQRDELPDEETVVKAKVALHHHRTKHQRKVLDEVVTSLQGAFKHCRRQFAVELNGALVEQSSLLVSELGQLTSHDDTDALEWGMDDAPSASSSGLVVAGETKEMRKNRQKAESKMRMRRKEIAQFAALTSFARLAYIHITTAEEEAAEDLLGRSLTHVLIEHREDWGTLVALEKRLFHTVRVTLGLQELVVRRLTERLANI